MTEKNGTSSKTETTPKIDATPKTETTPKIDAPAELAAQIKELQEQAKQSKKLMAVIDSQAKTIEALQETVKSLDEELHPIEKIKKDGFDPDQPYTVHRGDKGVFWSQGKKFYNIKGKEIPKR